MNKEQLLQTFQNQFGSLDKSVREEEIHLFLCNKSDSDFDREIFSELISRVHSSGKELTPRSFAETYHLAHRILI